jgi:Arc/MetJ family transcription regulator
MRTNILIEDALLAEAMRATGARSKREVVELGLKTLVRLRGDDNLREFRNRLTGDLVTL